MLTNKAKEKVIKDFQLHKGDTGSSEVQIAVLTKEIEELSKHLKKHYHDFSSRRGLLKKISQRRKLIKYLQKDNPANLLKVAKKLKLKIAKQLEAMDKVAAEQKEVEKEIKREKTEKEVEAKKKEEEKKDKKEKK